MQIALLGRQPKISLAELECLFGAENITPVGDYASLIDSNEILPQPRLGGTMKSATVITTLPTADLSQAFASLDDLVLDLIANLPEGKLQLGVSLYGFDTHTSWLFKRLLGLKKVIKKSGRSVRIIENKASALETAQVLYNKLTKELGLELLLIKKDNETIIARTTGVQDIDAYRQRDFERPKRDAFVGMLPPKLAQIMLNLASPDQDSTVLDPFCGTGVILQEALLMKHSVYGSDISERMVRYSRDNLNWLQEKILRRGSWYLETADAMTHTWRQPIDSVVGEVYLGQPLSSLPPPQKLSEIIKESHHISEAFLRNLAPQIKPGTRLCLALPAWHLGGEKFKHLRVLDHLADLGYNRLELKHAAWEDLIYHRPDQIVARELTILEKV